MVAVLNKLIFLLFLLVVAIGTTLKLYTRRRLAEIDGLSPIIKQDIEQERVVGEFGKWSGENSLL